jgi:hypothetical protein
MPFGDYKDWDDCISKNKDKDNQYCGYIKHKIEDNVIQPYKKVYNEQEEIIEAEYKGREVKLNKIMKGDTKKYKVFVKNPKTGNVKKVSFGDKGMSIKRDDPERKKSFRARHKCDQKKDKTSAGYWACRTWSNKKVSDLLKGK